MDKLRLVINGLQMSDFDDVSIDSDVLTPADAWSVGVFCNAKIPPQIAANQPIELWLDDEQVLAGVVDRVSESITRSGRRIALSGRDLAGQLLDCSVDLFAGQMMSFEKLFRTFVQGSNSPVPQGMSLRDPSVDPSLGWSFGPYDSTTSVMALYRQVMQNKAVTEPGESIWVALSKAAEASGMYLWMSPEGSLTVGNPFGVPTPPGIHLVLNYDGKKNNVLSAAYEEDGSELFSEIHILGQDNDAGRSFSAKKSNVLKSSRVLPDERRAAFDGMARINYLPSPRLRIAIDGQADSAAQAARLAAKAMADSQLQAFTLTIEVAGWRYRGEVWRPGWRVQVESDVLSTRACGQWAIAGRTLHLSRSQGQTTTLKLKRVQHWMNPVAHTDVFKDAAYRERKKAATKARRQAAAKAARLARAAKRAKTGSP